ATGNANSLARTHLDGLTTDRPGDHALYAVENLFVLVIHVGRRGKLLPGGNERLEHRNTAVGILAGQQEADRQWAEADRLFRRINGRGSWHGGTPRSKVCLPS